MFVRVRSRAGEAPAATWLRRLAALVLSTASLVGAQVWVTPRQGFGGRDAAGTLQNPYIVYDHGFPTAQLNTPQMGTPPPNQPLVVTPLGRPLGTNFGDPFGGRGVLGVGGD